MTLDNNSADLYFFQGGGNMGELIRQTDWNRTPLGDPAAWPASLQTAVAIMLDNPFGMYIAWGPEFTQLYNDGYRPILGATKHPLALGISSKITFAEIWHIIGPMLEGVMTGKAVRFLDFMLPLNRNGFIEECYFDFSYSPIRKDNGTVGGVLVTVVETTEKRKAVEGFRLNEEKIRTLVESAPFPIGVFEGEEMRVDLANQAIIDTWGKGHDVINKRFREIVPEVEDQKIFQQVEAVYNTGKPFHAKNQRVDLLIDGRLRPYYFNYSFTPLFDSSGNVYGVMNTAADVTDLNLAKQKIEESETKLRNTILQAPVAMCIFRGPDHVVELANDLMFELWGKPAEVFINKPLFDGLYEAKNQGFEELLDSVYNTGKTVRAEGIPVTLPRDGILKRFYVNILYQPYRDGDGTISGILAVAVDVSDQIAAHRRIEEAEEKARLAINSADLGVYEVIYSTEQVFTDQRFRDLFGLPETMTRSIYASLIHPDDARTREEAHRASLTSGHLEYQARFILPDKQIRWIKLTGKVIFDENKAPVKLIGVGQDVTASVTAQKEIEERERTIRNMVLQAPVAMCILRGPSFVVDLANNRMFEIWGKPEAELINKPIFEGLHEAREQGLESLLHDVMSTGKRFVANERPVNLPRNGRLEKTYLNFVYEPFRTGEGAITGIVAVGTDVTPQVLARHKIEEVVAERTKDLENANNELMKSNAELAQFAYIASHDLQEPLRKISTFSQMLGDNLAEKLDDRSTLLLEKISKSSLRMNKLIRDVLNYSELGRENEAFASIDLNHVVENIKSDFELLIQQKEAIIDCQPLPVIEAIPLQMSQLFMNMIGNSIKFVRKDVKPVLRISADRVAQAERTVWSLPDHTDYVRIQFADNGIGIKPQHREQIFNIFQRLHRKSEYEGTGIGLAMCKKIVQNHSGRISASGSSASGAVFTVILPIKQSHKME